MDALQGCLERNKPYFVMIFIQFVSAGMLLLSKAAITHEGMNPYVFVVYRQAFATLALAPFAFFVERYKINMDGSQGCLERNKPYFVMIFIQFVSAGMLLLSKAAITHEGMNPYVFVVYRQAFATLALAPFAFFVERITLSLNLFYFALNYVAATFATALTNTNSAITFILAVGFRMESLSIKQRHGLAKVIGSTLGLAGALLCTFARGPPMYSQSKRNILHQSKESYSRGDRIKGSLIILAANTAWCSWLIAQDPLIKQYPAKLRLTALQCFFSCATSAIWAAAKGSSTESWKLGWNVNLLSVFYCGVIVAATSYWLQVWVVEKKGPVFSAVFSPLALIITTIFSAIFFQETLHWGSVCGAILLVIGLYGILWGKSKEGETEANDILEENKDAKFEASEHKLQMKEETELESIQNKR